ncbi:ABC transporter ATP-binding protein [Solicola gregarius]|uniref:ABC transporter ATP-binding protein n=1 Tax=Solicola gregarius TaxID=2908642 RepID=A0AA46TJD5_9ACTN|nr:ABC transporter ATP-binding protein [Solicola gregarius]UYM06185.1 ABC transporter ATP-binding protein [Solicola gregarius]
MRSEPAVEVRGLSKHYPNGVRAVDSISLTVQRGEVYGFLGPNGAGKTTTARMLLGLITPTSGEVSVLGRAPGDPEALARIGALIEGPGFYPFLSGRDNLRVLARYARVDRARIDEVLAIVDLSDRAGDKFSGYSLGMKQRLGVAAALLKDPDLVILDEPTNGLDPAGMRDMRGLIRSLGDEGRTVVLSSHLLREVQQVCDRVGVINNGTVLTESTVADLRGAAELRVTTTEPKRAIQVVQSLPEVSDVAVDDDTLRLSVDESHTAYVNRALVESGIDVLELRREERELEDVFFELTNTEATKEPSHV